MPANTSPIYPLTPNCGERNVVITAANTDKTGAGAVLLFTAGANGSRFDKIKSKPLGTCVATVLRIFLNNGGSVGTPANNSLIGEVSLPATTISEVLAQVEMEWLGDTAMQAGYKIYLAQGTAVVAGWVHSGFGGDY